MNRHLRQGLIVAVLHMALVASLGARLLVDRAQYPRVWARAAPVDPNLPIRGRYVRLRIEAATGPGLVVPPARTVRGQGPAGPGVETPRPSQTVTLTVTDGVLVAQAADAGAPNALRAQFRSRSGSGDVLELLEPLAYFIPDVAADPSRRAPGEELWVEVTIPRAGPPRPIRLGVKKEGTLTPLSVR